MLEIVAKAIYSLVGDLCGMQGAEVKSPRLHLFLSLILLNWIFSKDSDI
tara:strand:- start:2738 stop:2884 length:147 start_codon:yes stop_codon:yes gene_type:complete